MPQELPGYYYDAEKNRYFPTKGPIPGTRNHPENTPSTSNPPPQKSQCRRRKTAKLIELRELDGNVISSGRGGSCNFEHEYQKELASQATIWKYKHMGLTASTGSLEQIQVDIQTSDGQKEADILLTGHMGIALNVYQVAEVDCHFDYGVEYMPERIWPSATENQAIRKKAPQITWIPGGQINMSSTICSIKAMGNHYPLADDVDTPIQQALISTIGSATSGGSVHILKLNNMSDSNLRLRAFEVASFNCTIWASECLPDGSQAVIGTNKGAALVNIETGAVSWLCRTKSDVFSQQFNQLGNIILCGFRNGAILTVDVREKQRGLPSGIPKHRIPFSSNICQVHSSRRAQKRTKSWFEVGGSIHPSCTIFMPSSISCLMSLKTDDQYFLASSMDGSIKLYDHRLIQKGPIQSYDEHVNSHTRIQLGVDPSERMMMSGGEDGKVRLWSIKTGELLFETKISKSVPTSLCWPQTGTGPKGMLPVMHGNGDNLYHQNHSWGAWLGSADDLCYIHGS